MRRDDAATGDDPLRDVTASIYMNREPTDLSAERPLKVNPFSATQLRNASSSITDRLVLHAPMKLTVLSEEQSANAPTPMRRKAPEMDTVLSEAHPLKVSLPVVAMVVEASPSSTLCRYEQSLKVRVPSVLTDPRTRTSRKC